MAEDTVNDAFSVVVNGPSLGCCNNVVRAAMDRYWKSKQRQGWHFYKTIVLEQLKDFDGSWKVLHKQLNENSKFNCME